MTTITPKQNATSDQATSNFPINPRLQHSVHNRFSSTESTPRLDERFSPFKSDTTLKPSIDPSLGLATLFHDTDDNGIVRGFEINLQRMDWRDIDTFFERYGFVVIRNAFSQEQIESGLQETWDLINDSSTEMGHNPIDRSDPATWENSQWNGGISDRGDNRGFVEVGENPFPLQAYWDNYQNPKITSLFSHLLGEEKIAMVEDRYGFMRPTKNILMRDGSKVDKPEWKTQSSWLHWDQNPWDQPGFQSLQGLLALTPHTLQSGGFTCVPGYHKEMDRWAQNYERSTVSSNKSDIVMVPKDCDDILSRTVPILMQPGDFLVWDSRLPHCNYPNSGSEPRACQYIRYEAPTDEERQLKAEQLNLRLAISQENGLSQKNDFLDHLSPLGKSLTCAEQLSEYSDVELEGIREVCQARQQEADGKMPEAISHYRNAISLFPKLDELL